MSDERWIVVPNWDKFQHYTDRNPPWIKVYPKLMHNDDYLELAPTARALLHAIWLLYALSDGQLNAKNVPQMSRIKPRREHWVSLNDAGFIHFCASKPLALARSRETETETERKRLRPKKAKTEPRPAAAAYQPHKPNQPGQVVDPEIGLELARRLAGNPTRKERPT